MKKNMGSRQQPNIRLLASLAFLACGLASAPTLAQTASVSFLNEFTDPQYAGASVKGVSDDGSVIVGEIYTVATGEVFPFRWTADTGIVIIQPTSWFDSLGNATGVSADGTKVSGFFHSVKAFSWTTDTGTFEIPFLPGGNYSLALAISADGSTVVGSSKTATGEEAYAWTESGGIVELGNFPGADRSQAVDVSADGSVITGWSEIIYEGFLRYTSAVRWTADTNGYNIEIPDFSLAPGLCAAVDDIPYKISADGTTLLGQVTFEDVQRTVFRWKTDGTIDYPVLPFSPFPYPSNETPVEISPNGSLIAFRKQIWVESTNTMVTLADIQDALANDFGVDMQGWDISVSPPIGSSGGDEDANISAMSVTPQEIVLVIQIVLPYDPSGYSSVSLPVIVHLPYLPAGHKPTTSCSATWESSAIGEHGLSVQPPAQVPYPSSNDMVRSLEVFDDGNGPMLYAGGTFQYAGESFIGNGIARWDGQQWLPVSTGMQGGLAPYVESLLAWDDGTGPALYATGSFEMAGTVFASNIAKWDGQQWSALGAGSSSGLDSLTAFDDGTGPGLYAIRSSATNPPGEDGRVVKWDGSQWSELGTNGIENCGIGQALAVFDDGTGPALYANFGSLRATHLVGCANMSLANSGKTALMKWDGTQWTLVGGGLTGGNDISDMIAWDDGSGPALYVVGWTFASAGGDPAIHGSILRWDGVSWSTLGATDPSPYYNGYTTAQIVDDGSGSQLMVAGRRELRQWDGQSWSDVAPFGCPGYLGDYGLVNSIAQYDDGLGNGIYFGGDFAQAGPDFARNIAMLRSCTPTPTGDCNADGGVDMLDYGFFSGCLSGPDGGIGVGCECSDLDGDGDVDLEDFQAFMEGFTG